MPYNVLTEKDAKKGDKVLYFPTKECNFPILCTVIRPARGTKKGSKYDFEIELELEGTGACLDPINSGYVILIKKNREVYFGKELDEKIREAFEQRKKEMILTR